MEPAHRLADCSARTGVSGIALSNILPKAVSVVVLIEIVNGSKIAQDEQAKLVNRELHCVIGRNRQHVVSGTSITTVV
jgi:hypothetical protein